MDQSVTVAVARADTRRAAVAQALALIEPELRARVTPDVLVKPNLVSATYQPASTHPDTLSVCLDFLVATGAERITVAEGASDAPAAFARFGYDRETRGLPVRLLDLNREETEWRPLHLTGTDQRAHFARLSRTVADAPCRVSLALAKTHANAAVTLGLKNMLSSIHPEDRVMMHGHEPGNNGWTGWKRLAIEFLKGDGALVRAATRLLGRARRARAALGPKDEERHWRSLSPAQHAFLRSVEAMNRNLVALAQKVQPHISVVDGFVAMHREGPRHGTPVPLGVVIAGTDAVAVDAVAAAVMGFDPRQIGYLVYAEAMGLGTADLDAIRVVGDPIERVRRRLVPHSNEVVHRHWHRVSGAFRVPPPHLKLASNRRVSEP